MNIDTGYSLNGRYPSLFHLRLLQKLSIISCDLKWNLEMLAGLPSLKELSYFHNRSSTGGNVNSLRVLKDTLENEKVAIEDCPNVQGNFMELADFPRLKELHLMHTRMTGDIRDIGERDFLALETLTLPSGVYTVELAMSPAHF